MTNFIFTNNAITTLASAATSSQTTLTLASSTNFPSSIPSGCVLNLTLNDAATRQIFEICYVTAISGTTVTVMRGQEGTSAQNWSVGDYAFVGLTAGMETAMSYGNGQTYGADTGSANAYVVALTPTLTAHVAGLPIRVKIANTNTGASTLNPGPAAVAITYENGDALAGGELVAGGIYEFIYNGTSYLLANPTSISDTTVGLTIAKVATPYTLQAMDGGKYFQANASEAFSLTLAAVLPLGARIGVSSDIGFAASLVVPSGITVYGESTSWTDTTLPIATATGGEDIILTYVAANAFIIESMTPATAIANGVQGALSLLNVGAGLVSSSGDLAVNRFTSANQTITVGSTLTIAHGLGAVPFATTVDLICLTAEGGFSVGQIVTYYSGYAETAAGTTLGIGIARDATNIYVTVPSGEISLFSPSTYDVVTITPANWAIIARAWA